MFEEVSSEIAILLIPREITLLDLEIVPPSIVIGSFYKTKNVSPIKKEEETRQPIGEGKEVLTNALEWE